MLPTRIKRRRKGYLEPSGSRWLAALYTRTKPYYAYDALGRPYSRDTEYPQKEAQHTASFSYNPSREFTNAQLDEASYAYDNIGKAADGCKADWTSASRHEPRRRDEATMRCRRINRRLAFGGADYAVYTANELNQYTKIDTNGSDFTPEYDADGNQTLVQTGTGIWKVSYNAQNRGVKFENTADGIVIDCAYDYMDRRIWKKVTTDGRWTRQDPIGIGGGVNLYLYGINLPIKNFDYTGAVIALSTNPQEIHQYQYDVMFGGLRGLGLILYLYRHYLVGKGKTVAFNSQFIEGYSNYTSTASSMINAAFDEMKQQKIYGKKCIR